MKSGRRRAGNQSTMPSVAIVGMACRYPDARSPSELWESVLAQRRAFRRISEGLIASLLGDSGPIRRGQGLVTGVAQGTKDELTRMISAEVRNFLDKIDAVDLVQQVVAGLVIEMKTEIRFTRAEDGKLSTQVETPAIKVRTSDE